MSHTWPSRNKHTPYQKVHFKEYLSSVTEPLDNPLQDTPKRLEMKVSRNGRDIRRDIRRRAKRLRHITERQAS